MDDGTIDWEKQMCKLWLVELRGFFLFQAIMYDVYVPKRGEVPGLAGSLTWPALQSTYLWT